MFNFKNLLLSTLLLATTVPAFAADDCCKDKEVKYQKKTDDLIQKIVFFYFCNCHCN